MAMESMGPVTSHSGASQRAVFKVHSGSGPERYLEKLGNGQGVCVFFKGQMLLTVHFL